MVSDVGLLVTIMVGSMKKPVESSEPPPQMIVQVSLLAALSIYPVILSKDLWSITAVMKLVKSRASPIFILPISEHRSSEIAVHTDLGI